MNEGRIVDLLLAMKQDLGEMKSDFRSMHQTLTNHIKEDDELVDRVSVVEKGQYRLSVVKAVAFSCFGVVWTIFTWYTASAWAQ